MPWDPNTYNKFQRERSAPFDDLLSLVKVRPGLRVVDLGCGTGELTRRLADHLPGSGVTGVDNSPQMLSRASEYARLGLRFEIASIEEIGGEWDLIFSHAALQWVDDHAKLMPRLLSMLRPGGQLTVQMPSNNGHLTHRLIEEMADQEPYRSVLGGWQRIRPVLKIDQYADLLFQHGAAEITVFEKVYPHILENADALADWTSGTALVPYFERLTDEMRTSFMDEYRHRLREAYPGSPVFYGFRRTLFAATCPER
jgi:trans-aconitate 2-methyltransferase